MNPRSVRLSGFVFLAMVFTVEVRAEESQRPWLSDMNAARDDALLNRRPILVRIGSESCPWCMKLDEEIRKPSIQKELAGWTLLELDLDKSPEEATRLGVGPIPALRVLTSRGRLIGSRDGYVASDMLAEWLHEQHEEAGIAPDEALLASHEPSLLDVVRIVRQFGDRDATVREAAILRLRQFPKVSAASVVKAFREGNLSSRLTAWELLHSWDAPVADMDPWRPGSLAAPQRVALDEWLSRIDAIAVPGIPRALTDAQLQQARADLDQLIKADAMESAAVRERLARWGVSLLPEVLARLREAATDEDRERLLALRYRLVANDSLVLSWPGGLERLADSDVQVRHKAAEELATMATVDQQPLLLALFSDPDPLVREISLRGLRQMGGEHAKTALAELLNDPQPNVRAAVLKQLTEDKSSDMMSKVAAYLKTEKDADLIVHAVRYFREIKSAKAVNDLRPLLEHESWQVRADAAEALGTTLTENPYGTVPENVEDIYAALLKCLVDVDAFVVNRALTGLKNVDAKHAVEPLVKAAASHPELAAKIVDILARGSVMRDAAIPYLHEFVRHENSDVRAAAVHGLAKTDPEHIKDVLMAAVRDKESRVRIAAAKSVLELIRIGRPGSSPRINSLDPFGVLLYQNKVDIQLATEVHAPPKWERDVLQVSDRSSSASSENIVFISLLQDPAAENAGATQPSASEVSEPPEELADKKASPDETKAGNTDVPAGETEQKASGETVAPVLDQWLTELYAGRHRAEWLSDLIEPLEKMLTASDPEERLAAGLSLLPFNRHEECLPVVLAAAKEKPALYFESTQVLEWLVRDLREEVFWQLFDLAHNETERASLIHQMTVITDERNGELYFRVLERPETVPSVAGAIQDGLRTSLLGNGYDSPASMTESMKKRVAAAVKPYLSSDAPRQRLAAMDLMLIVDSEQALSAARQVMEDPKQDEALRQDAYVIAFAAQADRDRSEAVAAALAGEDRFRRAFAVRYLALGDSSLSKLSTAGFQLRVGGPAVYSIAPAQPNSLDPPRRLTAEQVKPLLTQSDPETAAYAGYLLALFGDSSGLAQLLSHWKSTGQNSELDRLVYRAISALDDSTQIPALKQIYGRLGQYEKGEFYWTVRAMTGPAILDFRKKIRDEVGMENLR